MQKGHEVVAEIKTILCDLNWNSS